MCRKSINTKKGFTLVELMVVMVIMGLVITSVYSLFLNSKKTANTSEEVVDVQQNLRVAMDFLVADIRMAGFLIPHDQTAIASAPDDIAQDTDNDDVADTGTDVDTDGDETATAGEFFTLQTSSSMKTYARITGESFTDPTVFLELEDDMFNLFSTTDEILVIRPSTGKTLSNSWTISGITSADNEIKATDASYVAGTIMAGDMVVRKLAGEADPTTIINYWLRPTANAGTNNFELMRSDGNSDSVIARNIRSLDLTYLVNDGSEVASVDDADPDPAPELKDIRAIRINITGQTDEDKTAKYSGIKTRSLQTVVKIQNAFGG